MTLRDVLLGTLTFLLIVALGLALLAWLNRAPEPTLLVDAAAPEAPTVIPRPDHLFAPCPLTPRNLPAITKREA